MIQDLNGCSSAARQPRTTQLERVFHDWRRRFDASIGVTGSCSAADSHGLNLLWCLQGMLLHRQLFPSSSLWWTVMPLLLLKQSSIRTLQKSFPAHDKRPLIPTLPRRQRPWHNGDILRLPSLQLFLLLQLLMVHRTCDASTKIGNGRIATTIDATFVTVATANGAWQHQRCLDDRRHDVLITCCNHHRCDSRCNVSYQCCFTARALPQRWAPR